LYDSHRCVNRFYGHHQVQRPNDLFLVHGFFLRTMHPLDGALVDQVAELPRMFCPGVPVLQAWVVSAIRSDGVWSSELAHPWECMLCSSPVCIHTCTQHWRVHWNFPLFRSTDRSVQRRELGRSNCLLPKFPSQGIFVYFRSSIIVVQDDAHQRAPAYTHNRSGF